MQVRKRIEFLPAMQAYEGSCIHEQEGRRQRPQGAADEAAFHSAAELDFAAAVGRMQAARPPLR